MRHHRHVPRYHRPTAAPRCRAHCSESADRQERPPRPKRSLATGRRWPSEPTGRNDPD